MLKKVYDSPEMEITRISFQAIMEQISTSVGEDGEDDFWMFLILLQTDKLRKFRIMRLTETQT